VVAKNDDINNKKSHQLLQPVQGPLLGLSEMKKAQPRAVAGLQEKQ
jgi:hypothetical protein